MKLHKALSIAAGLLGISSLLVLPGCINTSNIETEKPQYSQWQWTVPFAILDDKTQETPSK